MILLQDFREKKGHHNEIEGYCQLHNIPIYRVSLDVGDYMIGEIRDNKAVPIGTISVDTKQDLAELASDLYKDSKAFNQKYRKCYNQKIKLYVLVQEEVTSLDQICKWRSKHSRITGRLLYDMMSVLQRSYGVRFCFCARENVADCIMSILTGKTTVK